MNTPDQMQTLFAVLAPYLPKVAEGFATKTGEEAAQVAAKLLKGLASLFRGDAAAQDVIANFTQDPVAGRGEFEALVGAKAADDPQFTAALRRLVAEAEPTILLTQDVSGADSVTGVEEVQMSRGKLHVDQRATDARVTVGVGKITLS